MKLEFIKNVLNIDVDGLRGINRYTVQAMYDEIDEDNFATPVFKLVDEFELTWNEIAEKGGIDKVNKELKERYKV